MRRCSTAIPVVETTATSVTPLVTKPYAGEGSAASIAARAIRARSAGSSPAVASSKPADLRDRLGLRKAGKARLRAGALGGLGGAPGELGEPVLVEPVRLCAANAPVAHHAQVHDHVLDQGRLVHLRGREPREPGALREDDDLGLLLRRRCERRLGDLAGEGHELTPISTPRNRHGAAPCETCAPWPGWPLPQFVRPYIRHDSGPPTASSEPQNRGVIPV